MKKSSGDDKNKNKENEEASKNDKAKEDLVEKKPNYDKLSKDDLVKKLKESDEKINMYIRDKETTANKYKDELAEKDKIINSIAKTNKKLVNDLEILKREVDRKLDKVSIKDVQKAERTIEEKKQHPLEVVLKVKERELKNTMAMMEIMKRDKESLQKNLDEKSDYKKVVNLEDLLQNEKKENQNLAMEIKILQKMLEDHNKKCIKRDGQYEEKDKTTRDDMRLLKDKNRDLIHKLKAEEDKHRETRDKLLAATDNFDKIKVKVPDYENFIEKNKKATRGPGTLDDNVSKPTRNLSSVRREKKDYLDGRKSPSKSVKLGKLKPKGLYQTSEENKLFTSSDLSKLEKLLSKAEVERLEKRYGTIDHKSISLEKKYNADFKTYTKKLTDIEEQLEFVTLQLKEAEQRAKIFQFQVHEHKVENKAQGKRSHELQNNIDILQKLLMEKENENKVMMNRVQDHQKQVEILRTRNGELLKLNEYYSRQLKENEDDDGIGETGRYGEEEQTPNEDEGEEGDDQNNNIKPQRNKGLDDGDVDGMEVVN